MKAFKRAGDALVTKLDAVEVALLSSLVEQLAELLGDGPEIDSDDPFVRWTEQRAADQLDRDDPVIRRLFPDAHPDDVVAAEEFRRFTADEQRRAKLSAAHLVLTDLAATEQGRRKLAVVPDRVEAWLKTVNAVRLSLAVRLGIDDEDAQAELEALPDRDPRAYVLDVYNWLGFLMESLIDTLHKPSS